jgi:hypothetical protein
MTTSDLGTALPAVGFDSNLARVARPDDCDAFIRGQVYKPEYRSLT